MKKLFLTSTFADVADKLHQIISNPKGLKLAFVPTARDPYPTSPWVDKDWQKLVELGFDAFMYDIKDKNEESIYNDLKNVDVIFVCGGNSFYLLFHAKQSGFDKAAKRLVQEGKIYIGSSAGSLLAGPTIEPIKNLDKLEDAPGLKSFEALGLVDFVVLPHMNAIKYQERNQKAIKEYKDKLKIIPLNDDQAVLVEDEKWTVI